MESNLAIHEKIMSQILEYEHTKIQVNYVIIGL